MWKTLVALVLIWVGIILLVIFLITKNPVFLLIALPIQIIGLGLTIWRELEKTKKVSKMAKVMRDILS
ncbi:MAG: hypothetical protein COU82_00265 [Candidatus Portnoybacteria bacterium CG10_big_fil_rev_8_21_14_0_10_38_18]|uniref:Uncharacterized protein n=1 Tax=Candidatus Portnoybacteria bacterium CG10_big_fil_rev_8_21_14_0_10_38_18 TaxID=1974813 RepID=A0A2M8KCT6_9BACT|nr:MAG: hypothetical protein COU82_00265 [Candidatus Portnoybacteria bacterium CG10_big_fil_rev_8_21_14_0_10_38_18]